MTPPFLALPYLCTPPVKPSDEGSCVSFTHSYFRARSIGPSQEEVWLTHSRHSCLSAFAFVPSFIDL